jgi:hypothetical protein
LDKNLIIYPNGVKDRLTRAFADDDPRGDALTFRVEDTTEGEVMDAEERRQCSIESKRLALQWQCQLQKLVDQYEFYAMN